MQHPLHGIHVSGRKQNLLGTQTGSGPTGRVSLPVFARGLSRTRKNKQIATPCAAASNNVERVDKSHLACKSCRLTVLPFLVVAFCVQLANYQPRSAQAFRARFRAAQRLRAKRAAGSRPGPPHEEGREAGRAGRLRGLRRILNSETSRQEPLHTAVLGGAQLAREEPRVPPAGGGSTAQNSDLEVEKGPEAEGSVHRFVSACPNKNSAHTTTLRSVQVRVSE